jgi:hypothetical protein
MKGENDMDTGISIDFDEHQILYYNDKLNIFLDDGGYIVYDIFRIVSPNDLYLFREKKEDIVLRSKLGMDVRLIYGDASGFYEYAYGYNEEEEIVI